MRYSLFVKRNRSGFTLLELLVVVAIIGFLSSVSIVALSASRAKSRDTQRKLDQVTVVKAAELYTNDFGAPPSQLCRDDNGDQQCDGDGAFLPTPNQSVESRISELFQPIAPAYAQEWGVIGDVDTSGCIVVPFCAQCQTLIKIPLPGPGGWANCLCTPPIGTGVCTHATCGDGTCQSYESAATCLNDCHCGDNVCQQQYNEEATCPAECGCNLNSICEGSRLENISNCQDCAWVPGGGIPGTCGTNEQCDAGETPGNCPSDCEDYSMCYVSGEWNLCCLFGGTYCDGAGGTTATGGYYGVCNLDRCEQKYLLQRPAFTCTTDAQCVPSASGVASKKFVKQVDTNWLKGLEPYAVTLPKDPGGNKAPEYSLYYASSHPDIVGRHRFCVWVSLERVNDNFNPYNDLTETPTGPGDPLWTPLCVQ